MSILETFYILFKTDADEAAKDIKKVDDASDGAVKSVEDLEKAFRAAKIRAEELTIAAEKARLLGSANAKDLAAQAALARLNAQELGLELQKINDSAETAAMSLGKMLGVIGGALAAFLTSGAALNIATQRAAAVRELDQFSSKLNSSISDVDAFQRVVKGMGGETSAALDSLVKLGEKVNEAFSDAESGARKDFTDWGLAFKGARGEALGASDAMLKLAGNLENVSRAEALTRIKKLGIEDAASIDLLLKGRAALEQRIRAEKELGVVTEEQAAGVREYYGELGRTQNAMTSISNAILTALLPAMIKTVKIFGDLAEWVKHNGTLVKGFFIALAGIVTTVFIPAMLTAAAATIAATWPLIALIALAAAFALAYEDVDAYLRGQPSLIGELAKKYKWFGDLIEWVAQTFKFLQDAGGRALDALIKGVDFFLLGLRTAWGDIVNFVHDLPETWDRLVGGVKSAAQAIKDGFSAAFTYVKSVWDSTIGVLADQISGIADRVRELLKTIGIAPGGTINVTSAATARDNVAAAGRSIGAMMGRGQAMTAGASGAAINTAPPGTTVNTSNVSVGNVTVNTQATDAKAVAGAVRGELQRQLRGTAAQFDDGVDR